MSKPVSGKRNETQMTSLDPSGFKSVEVRAPPLNHKGIHKKLDLETNRDHVYKKKNKLMTKAKFYLFENT